MELFDSGHFCRFEPGALDSVTQSIRESSDPWMTAADFRSYVDAQSTAGEAYRDAATWNRMSILNTSWSGRFSTDRTISDYNADIWKLDRIKLRAK